MWGHRETDQQDERERVVAHGAEEARVLPVAVDGERDGERVLEERVLEELEQQARPAEPEQRRGVQQLDARRRRLPLCCVLLRLQRLNKLRIVANVRGFGWGITHGAVRDAPPIFPLQANCRTHRPQKLKCLISLCTNPVSILSVPIQTVC